MEKIKITLVRSLPTIKLILDRFVESIRLKLRHIDYATDRMSASVKMWISGTATNIENTYIIMRLRVPMSIHHVDRSVAYLAAKLRQWAAIKSIDYSVASVVNAKSLLEAGGEHIDYDKSAMRLVLAYPVLLGVVANMTLGTVANKTLGELTFDEIA